MISKILFRPRYSHTLSQNSQQQLENEILGLSEDRILYADLDELCEYFYQRFYQDVPALLLSEKKVERLPKKNNSVLKIALHIPFKGDPTLFDVQPSISKGLHYPSEFKIENQTLSIFLSADNPFVRNSPESYNTAFDDYIGYIEENLQRLRIDLGSYNNTIASTARRLIEKQKNTILEEINLLENLGLPIRKRENAPEIIPIKRKKLTLPVVQRNPRAKELELELKQYDNILETVQLMAHVLERSPQAFSQITEEDLRWLFLFPLNGHYEIQGQASGETFNFTGKTDILIRVNDENIFVAECKIWDGKKYLLDAIDQLLGYVTWRDTKTAILIFNRRKDLSNVLNQISEIVSSHDNYRSTIEWGSETQFRFKFSHRDDKKREFYLSILVFEVPK